MKSLEKEHDKLQQICDVLKKQTLEPAQLEAEKIILDAKAKAEQILLSAQQQADAIIHAAKATIEQERTVFQSSLNQAGQQSLEALKQSIEQHLFNPTLHNLIEAQASEPSVIAQLIQCIITAVEKEGSSTEFTAYIPSHTNPQQINALLSKEILNKLTNQSVSLGNFGGGAKVKVANKNLTVDLSSTEISDLMQRYLRKDFRTFLFKSH